MSDLNQTPDSGSKTTGFAAFASARIIGGIALAIMIIGVLSIILGYVDDSTSKPLIEIKHKGPRPTATAAKPAEPHQESAAVKPADHGDAKHAQDAGDTPHETEKPPVAPTKTETDKAALHPQKADQAPVKEHTDQTTHDAAAIHETDAPVKASQTTPPPAAPAKPADQKVVPQKDQTTHETPAQKDAEHAPAEHEKVSDKPADEHAAKPEEHATAKEDDHGHGLHLSTQSPFPVKGMAFVDAAIHPIQFELTKRFWGWRPNDILSFTDNVESFQLGVLEVTRRTAVALAERLSRTGSTAAFDPTLQNAMNWFMIKADRYWFPSAESKYKEGIEELSRYFKKLEKGEANFFTRTDNLIPLLAAYEDLLGSCDENLVKFVEDDGSPVSFFQADDYFYYAQGIASAMMTVMQAVLQDFHTTVDGRRGTEVLIHAIESLHHATAIDPLLILNSDLNGIMANHRANMAAPISHAKFYIGLLIKTLST